MSPDALLARGRRGLFGLYFEAGIFGSVAAFSTFMSSPWTIERTAKARDASEATRKYTWMAHVFNLFVGGLVTAMTGSSGALLGATLGTTIMGVIYRYSRACGLATDDDEAGGWWDGSFSGEAVASGSRPR